MKVLTNTAMTLDGKIASYAYENAAIGSRVDRAYMSVLRARADAVLVGGRTFRNGPFPLVPDPTLFPLLDKVSFPDRDVPPLKGRRWWNVVVTRTLAVPTFGRFYEDPRVRPLFLTSSDDPAPAEVARAPEVTVPWILAELESRGVETLLLEAGGDLLASFFEADAVDEIYLTICPALLGGRDAPTLVDGAGFPADKMRRLRTKHVHRVGEELYCRYQVLKG